MCQSGHQDAACSTAVHLSGLPGGSWASQWCVAVSSPTALGDPLLDATSGLWSLLNILNQDGDMTAPAV